MAGKPMTDEMKAKMAEGRRRAAAERAQRPPQQQAAPQSNVVSINTPAVSIQMGPTPGYAFAVFKDNPEYHQMPLETWNAAARLALMRKVAILGGDMITDVRPEPLRPLNWMVEYRVPR